MRPDGRRDPHPARRARRAVAAASGVAFVGLAAGMAINTATTSSAETTPATTLVGAETPTTPESTTPESTTPESTTPESTWSANPVPTTVPQQVTRVPHTQSHGS